MLTTNSPLPENFQTDSKEHAAEKKKTNKRNDKDKKREKILDLKKSAALHNPYPRKETDFFPH